jgi:hypothetical protein
VVFDGIDEHRRTAEILLHRGHVGVERWPDGVRQQAGAVFRAENKMDVQSREGLGHELGRPFRAWLNGVSGFPGRCPGLLLDRAVGAGK